MENKRYQFFLIVLPDVVLINSVSSSTHTHTHTHTHTYIGKHTCAHTHQAGTHRLYHSFGNLMSKENIS